MRQVILVSLVLLFISSTAIADEPQAPSPPPVATAAKQKHDDAVRAAREAFHNALIAADEQYVADLDAALKQAMAAQNIDLATKIDDAKKAAVAMLNLHQRPTSLESGQPNLAHFFNRIGVVNDGDRFPITVGLDGANFNAYSAAMSSSLLGPSVTWNDTSFTLGDPGVNDVIAAAGQTINLPHDNYTSLRFLATAVRGNQRDQSFTVMYTDGAMQRFTEGVSDWFSGPSFPTESVAVRMNYRNASDGTKQVKPFYLYAYDFRLVPSKTVQSITLPDNGNVCIFAITLVH